MKKATGLILMMLNKRSKLNLHCESNQSTPKEKKTSKIFIINGIKENSHLHGPKVGCRRVFAYNGEQLIKKDY